MIDEAQRRFLFEGRKGKGLRTKSMFAKVVKDYEWSGRTLPAGTIVLVELYRFPPDVINLDGRRFLLFTEDLEFFEVIE